MRNEMDFVNNKGMRDNAIERVGELEKVKDLILLPSTESKKCDRFLKGSR